jgi:hypothetical protein
MAELKEKQAYLAMFAFLEAHYARTGSDDIGSLLGDLSLLPDGGPADPAVTDDWSKAVADAKSGRVSANMELRR